MAYKVLDEDLNATVQDWSTEWQEPISVKEVSMIPPKNTPEDLVRGPKQQSHHDSDGESSIETPIDIEAQRIFKEIRMK